MKKGGGRKHRLPARLPFGEILNQTQPVKKQWRLGDLIGQGGFGLIYTAFDVADGRFSQTSPYVIKVEPMDNGPLFCEFHFYQRAAKPDQIHQWTRTRGLPYLGVPEFHGWGQHSKGSHHYRFLVLQRLSFDLQKVFVQRGRLLPQHTALAVGLRMLDAVEYIHAKGYCHADIKAANILLGFSKGTTNYDQAYLVDFGLVSSYLVKDVHRPYRQDPKQAHNGTVEFTSRDAHNGALPSRRGDVETLGYCLLQWMTGCLPWEGVIRDPDKVCRLKTQYMKDIPGLLEACFETKPYPEGIERYLECVAGLNYEAKPPYDHLRQCLGSGLQDEWTLGLSDTLCHARGVKRTDKHAGLSTPQQWKIRHTSSSSGTPRGLRLSSSEWQHNTPQNSRRLSSSSSSAPGSSARRVAYPAALDSDLFKTPRIPCVTSSARKARQSGVVRTPQRVKVSTPVVTPLASSAGSSGETGQDWDDWQTDGADFDDYYGPQDDMTTDHWTESMEEAEQEEVEEEVEEEQEEVEDDTNNVHASWRCLIL